MAYTTIDKPEDHFNIVTYTGNNTNNRSITGLGFQPDLTWIKMRQSQTSDHALFDSNRGTNKKLASNSVAAEVSPSQYGGVGSFDSDGFTLVNGTTAVLGSYMFEVNKTSETYVGWNWKANGGTTSSNTDGTITSTVQANTDAGFSIGTFTGTWTSGDTVGHGLGIKPDMLILKSRDNPSGAAMNWVVAHKGLDDMAGLSAVFLNGTNAKLTGSAYWGNVAPTTSVFTVGDNAAVNYVGNDMVFYAFAEKQGFSKFGKYTGNGNANGTFVYTGFAPAFVMIKDTSQATNWEMFDVKRNPFNVRNLKLGANLAVAENGSDLGTTSQNNIDILSNGFKMRTGNTDTNVSGDTYIYMAFAENPFVTSTGIPTTAR